MTMYMIENTITGTTLGTFDADSEGHALDLMAQAAGYRDYADAQAVAPSAEYEVAITAVPTAQRAGEAAPWRRNNNLKPSDTE
jgi:hypothetical protein